jgi:hypothetical protein
MAKTISTPSLLTVSSLVPILGFTKPKTKKQIPSIIKISFKAALKLDLSGASLFNKSEVANFFWVFFFHTCIRM